jgi:hypothetical protein
LEKAAECCLYNQTRKNPEIRLIAALRGNYWVLEGPELQLLLPPSAFDNDRATWGLLLA